MIWNFYLEETLNGTQLLKRIHVLPCVLYNNFTLQSQMFKEKHPL